MPKFLTPHPAELRASAESADNSNKLRISDTSAFDTLTLSRRLRRCCLSLTDGPTHSFDCFETVAAIEVCFLSGFFHVLLGLVVVMVVGKNDIMLKGIAYRRKTGGLKNIELLSL